MAMKTLDEARARKLLESAGVPMCPEAVVDELEKLPDAANSIGYPCVLKGIGEGLEHKTELGVVFCGLKTEDELLEAAKEISKRAPMARFLVQRHVEGKREFICGLIRDDLFGPTVMFGIGGVLAEGLRDVAFRLAPLTFDEAKLMISEIRSSRLLDEFRGEKAADTDRLANIIVAIGDLAVRRAEIVEIDLNPVIIDRNGKPVAVDYLVRVDDAQHP
ncbi:MAG TPA: carboxylate--amine ligase [Proteobacteria bacterium]|nr:carboxylate--amine ligase [Pseudomonadota bacterium]